MAQGSRLPRAAARPLSECSPSSKRQRPDGSSQIELNPFERAALGEAESVASGAVTATVDAIVEGLKSVLVDLPKQVATATAAAVRAFDLSEEEKAAAAATRQSAAPFVAKIDACKNCFDIGQLEGFRFDQQHGDIICNCCFRYASSSYVPLALKARTARSVGVIEGIRNRSTLGPARAFFSVKAGVKQHVQTQIHQWCSHHEVVESQYASERRRAGIIISKLILQAPAPLTTHHPHCIAHTRTHTCTHTHTHTYTHTRARPSASVALQGVKCHDSDLSFEGRVTMLQTIGVDVGTKNHSRWFVPHLRSSFHAVTCAGLELVLTKVMPAIDRPASLLLAC